MRLVGRVREHYQATLFIVLYLSHLNLLIIILDSLSQLPRLDLQVLNPTQVFLGFKSMFEHWHRVGDVSQCFINVEEGLL